MTTRIEGRTTPRPDLSLFHETLFDDMPIGASFVDTDLRYIRMNRALAAINGVRAEDVIGRHVDEVLPSVAGAVVPTLRRVLETGEPAVDVAVTGETPAAPGVQRHWVASYHPIKKDGKVTGVCAIVTEVTDRERAEYAIQVVGVASHDLIGPISSILLSASSVERHARGSVGDAARRIQRAALYMKDLIEDLLDATSLVRGRLPVHPSPCDVQRLVESVLSLFEPIASAKSLKLASRACAGLVVQCDYNRVHQALSNLVSNAIKFTASGSVVVGVEKSATDEQSIIFTVQDTGIGIAPEHLPHIFEEFWKGPGSPTRGSVGLGLAIVRLIVQAHGGRVWVESEQGRGSKFCFTLPLAKAPGERAPERAA